MDAASLVPEWAKLARTIKQQRTDGQVIVSLVRRTGSRPEDAATEAVRELGLTPVKWRALDRADAAEILEKCLHCDLAYSAPIMPVEVARQLASRVLAFFDDAVFFTNRSLAEGTSTGSWDPVTTATFDTGIIAVSAAHVAVVWFLDED